MLLVIGFILLIFGANRLVDSSSLLAKRLGVSDIAIGLTIVAFGTSSPELVVNIFASVNKNSDIVLGNIIGSNIFNILIILGISAIIYPININKNTLFKEIPFTIISAVLIFILSNNLFVIENDYIISRKEGIILLLFFAMFLYYTFTIMKKGVDKEEALINNKGVLYHLFFIILGIILLTIGGKLIVDDATSLATKLGISQRMIAITIVAFGTSLPELATSVVAAIKKNSDIAVGNILGSNVFNIFFIGGLSAIINPVKVSKGGNFDLIINIVITVILFLLFITGKKMKLGKLKGSILVLIYILYVIYILKGI